MATVRIRVWVFLLSLAFLVLGNDRLILYSLDEVKNAQCAREMYAGGEWVVPTFNGELRTQKPPLAYYFMMGSYAVGGATPFAARFGSGLCGAVLVLLVLVWGQRHLNARAGWIAAAGLLAGLHFGLQFRMSVPDPYLVLALFTAVYSIWRGWEQRSWAWLLAGYLLTGLAVLAKGPVGAWIVGATLLAYVVWTGWGGGLRAVGAAVWRLQPLVGVLVAAAVALPWYYLVTQATDGAWLADFMGYHNLQRFSEPLEGHGGGFYVTLLFAWVGMLPLGVFFPQALVWGTRAARTDGFVRLCACAAAVVVLTFVFAATRLPNYTVPAYPFLALLAGAYLDRVLAEPRLGRSLRWNLLVWAVLLAALPVGAYFGLRGEPAVADLAPLSVVLVLLPGVAVWAWMHWPLRRAQALSVLLGGFAATALLVYAWVYPAIYQRNPVTQTLPHIPRDQPVVAFRRFNPAFTFELPLRPIQEFRELPALAAYLQAHPGATVVSAVEHRPALDSLPRLHEVARAKDIFEHPTTLVLRQRPDPAGH